MPVAHEDRAARADGTPVLDEPLPVSGWHGPYPGTVVSTEDPLRRGRIQVRAPQVYGDPTQEQTFIPDDMLPWARPSFPCHDLHAGFEPGDGVWLLFWGQESSNPLYLGQFLGEDEGSSDVPDEFVSSYTPDPKTRLLRTRNGHQIEMRWVEGQEYIRVTTAGGQVFDMQDATAPAGPKISLTITDQKRIEIDGLTQAINIIAPAGTINIQAATGAVNVNGQGVNVNSTAGGPTSMVGTGTLLSNYTGAANYVFGGILAYAVAGAYTIVAGSMTITAAAFGIVGVVALGIAGVKFRLAHEQIFQLLQDMLFFQVSHVHPAPATPSTTPGTVAQNGAAPRAGGLVNLPPGTVSTDVLAMTTQSTTAN